MQNVYQLNSFIGKLLPKNIVRNKNYLNLFRGFDKEGKSPIIKLKFVYRNPIPHPMAQGAVALIF
jgi:hypothetical protein